MEILEEKNEKVFSHYPVMLNECIDALHIKEDGIYVDCTLGGAGHSTEIAKRLTKGRLISIDTDINAIEVSKKRLEPYLDRVTLVNDNFKNIEDILERCNVSEIDGALIDLGVSSYQLDTPERGFSYMKDAPLDMRMNVTDKLSAYEVVNEYSALALKDIIYRYGEERYAPKIASAIVSARENKKIETTLELVEIIKKAIPGGNYEKGSHPAKRTFQAIRIEVNSELDIIEPTLRSLVKSMKKDAYLAVITFHSLEDRIAKETFRSLMGECTCPRELPVCVCGCEKIIENVARKPILPSEKELCENSRSHSAKLRVVKKVKG